MPEPNARPAIRIVLLVLLALTLIPSGFATAQDAVAESTLEPLAEGSVTVINGESVSAATFQERVRAVRFLYAYTIRETARRLIERGYDVNDAFQVVQSYFSNDLNLLLVSDMMGISVLENLVEETLLAQLAPEYGITITDEGIAREIAAFVSRPLIITDEAEATPEATEELVQSQTDETEAIEALFSEAERRAGVSAEALRSYFAGQLLREQFAEHLAGPLLTESPYVTARHILLESEEEAVDVLERLEAGDEFADVAREVSIDRASGELGGDLGSVIPDLFVEPIADAVREAEIGVVLGPIETEFGFHLIEVTARETRPVDPESASRLQRLHAAAFRAWLDEQLESAQIEHVENWPDLIPSQPEGSDLLADMLSEL